MITSISNNNLISDTISDKDIQTKKVKKRDRKEFLETRTRYGDIAKEASNDFDKIFITGVGGIIGIVATFIGTKTGGVESKILLAFARTSIGISILAFTLSFIWSRQVNWLRQEECDEKYLHGNSEKKQEINQKCLIINDRLIWSKYISLFFAGVGFVLIIVFLYLNTPENCVSNCMFYFHK